MDALGAIKYTNFIRWTDYLGLHLWSQAKSSTTERWQITLLYCLYGVRTVIIHFLILGFIYLFVSRDDPLMS